MLAEIRKTPWQVHLAVPYLVFVIATSAIASAPSIGTLLHGAVQGFASEATALQRFQLGLVILVGCFFVIFYAAWSGGIVALYFGKPWSIFFALGTAAFVLFAVVRALWAFPLRGHSIPWVDLAIRVLLVVVTTELLFSDAGRRHLSLQESSRGMLILGGVGVGLAGVLLFVGAGQLVVAIGAWMRS